MRNKLECSVTACRHNEHNFCDLPGIKVEGPGARESRQTCCESFPRREQQQCRLLRLRVRGDSHRLQGQELHL